LSRIDDALEKAASTEIGGGAPQLLSAPKQRAQAFDFDAEFNDTVEKVLIAVRIVW
jgi:hypothetical protein